MKRKSVLGDKIVVPFRCQDKVVVRTSESEWLGDPPMRITLKDIVERGT